MGTFFYLLFKSLLIGSALACGINAYLIYQSKKKRDDSYTLDDLFREDRQNDNTMIIGTVAIVLFFII